MKKIILFSIWCVVIFFSCQKLNNPTYDPREAMSGQYALTGLGVDSNANNLLDSFELKAIHPGDTMKGYLTLFSDSSGSVHWNVSFSNYMTNTFGHNSTTGSDSTVTNRISYYYDTTISIRRWWVTANTTDTTFNAVGNYHDTLISGLVNIQYKVDSVNQTATIKQLTIVNNSVPKRWSVYTFQSK